MFWFFVTQLQGAPGTSKNQTYTCNASYVQYNYTLGVLKYRMLLEDVL